MIVAAGCITLLVLITIVVALTCGLWAGVAIAAAGTLGFVVGVTSQGGALPCRR